MEEYGIPYSENTKFFKDRELTMEIELAPDQIKELYKVWGYEMIIRCKDCKHWKPLIDINQASYGLCYGDVLNVKKRDGFCDRGELRDECRRVKTGTNEKTDRQF